MKCVRKKNKICKNYYKINWVVGYELLLFLMECGIFVDILVKMVFLLLRII